MADEKVNLLIDVEIKANEAVKRNQELKQSLIDLRAEQATLTKANETTSEQFVTNEARIKSLTAQYNANTRVLQAQATASSEVSGAYAILNKEAAEAAVKAKDMAVAYGASDVRTKSAVTSAKALSDQLKEVDSSVGQNQRRVGDYAGELGKLPGAMGGVAQGASGLKAGFNALSATPLLGIIQILMVVFGALSNAMGGGSDASLKLKQVMAPLTTLFQGFQVVLSEVVGWLVNGVAAIGSFISKTLDFIPVIGRMNEATAKTIELERERQKIAEENRNEVVNDAKDEMKIADLRNKIAQETRYTTEERLKFAREADKIAKAMMIDDVNRATRTYNLMVKQMKAEGKGYKDLKTEERDSLKAAEAEMFKVKTEYSTSTRRLKSTESTLIQEIEADKQAKLSASEKSAEKRKEEQAKKTQKQIEADKKAEEERIKKLKENADKAIEVLDNELKLAQLKQQERLAGQKLTDEQIYANKQQAAIDNANNEAAVLEAKLLNEQITQEEFNTQSILNNQALKTELAVQNAEFDAQQKEQKDLALAAEFQAGLELKTLQNDILFEAESEALEKSYKLQLEAATKAGVDTTNITALYAKQKELIEQKSTAAKLDLASGFASNIAEIFGKQSKVGKAAASAAIAIDTVKGAMAAFTSMQAIPVVGVGLGIAAAAAVTMKGVKAIKDVWAVKSGLPGDGGGGGASIPSSGGGGNSASSASVTGGLVARTSGETQQTATTTAMTKAMEAAPTKTVLVTNDLTTAMNEKVSLKTDNSL